MNENILIFDKIKELRKVCKIVSILKSQLIKELPHYGHNALFLNDDQITTGVLNNTTEITIHLITGQLLYFHNEQSSFVDLTEHNLVEKLERIVTKYELEMPQTEALTSLRGEDLSYYLSFAKKANKSLKLFRMKLRGHLTHVHLWPDGFDFSLEWFTDKRDQQIAIGISPGENQYETPYLYVNPYPFDEKMLEQQLFIGQWHTSGWNGIKVEWKELQNKTVQEISDNIYDLFLIAQLNLSKEK